MLSYSDAAAEVMKHLIYHDAHGYSQYERDGNWDTEVITLSDGTQVAISGGDRDCSSAVIDCYESLGVSCGGASYTGNMESGFLGSGNFIEINPEDAENGDVFLRDGHTEMCLYHDGMYWQGGFRISELGTIYGEEGDQTGWESDESECNVYAWEQCFRCIAPRQESTPVPEPVMPRQIAGEPENNFGFTYRAHCENAGWFDAVRDRQTAGSIGFGARLEAFKISPPKGLELTVIAHIQDYGDRTYRNIKASANSGEGSSENDPIIGTVGEALRLEGFMINVTKREGNLVGTTLYYRTHVQNIGWTDWVKEGEYSGTKGQGLRVEAIEIKLVVSQDLSTSKNSNGIIYQAHVKDYGWLPIAHDGQIAGTTGQARRIEAIRFVDLPDGLVVDGTVHCQDIGDVTATNIKKNTIVTLGTVGEGRRAEAITLTEHSNSTGKRLCYQAHVENIGWTNVCHSGELCGTKGKGQRLEAVKIWTE